MEMELNRCRKRNEKKTGVDIVPTEVGQVPGSLFPQDFCRSSTSYCQKGERSKKNICSQKGERSL